MKTFKEQFEYDDEEDGMINRYHELVSELLFQLSTNIDGLNDEISDIVFELSDIANELSMDSSDNDDDYTEVTTANAVGIFKPKLFGDRDEEEDDDDEMDESENLDEVSKKHVKRNKAMRLIRRKEYRINRSKLKIAGQKMRRTARYKKYLKKKKRFSVRGLTTKKVRQKEYTN